MLGVLGEFLERKKCGSNDIIFICSDLMFEVGGLAFCDKLKKKIKREKVVKYCTRDMINDDNNFSQKKLRQKSK